MNRVIIDGNVVPEEYKNHVSDDSAMHDLLILALIKASKVVKNPNTSYDVMVEKEAVKEVEIESAEEVKATETVVETKTEPEKAEPVKEIKTEAVKPVAKPVAVGKAVEPVVKVTVKEVKNDTSLI